MILADTLSWAFPPAGTETKFPDKVAALSTDDAEQTTDVQMIASAEKLVLIDSATGYNEYIRLQ